MQTSPALKPAVFFFPPAEGDAPRFADFRRAVETVSRFETISYPDYRALVDGGGSLQVIVDAAVDQICTKSDSDRVILVGYSFGGFVAWETARRLSELGREPRMIGLIDARWQVHTSQTRTRSLRTRIQRSFQNPGRVLARIGWGVIFPGLVRFSPRSMSHGVVAIAAALPFARGFSDRMLVQLRLMGLASWAPKFLVVPTYLFKSDEFAGDSPDFGWGAACSRLTVIPIGGTHLGIFEPPHLERLTESFLATLSSGCGAQQQQLGAGTA